MAEVVVVESDTIVIVDVGVVVVVMVVVAGVVAEYVGGANSVLSDSLFVCSVEVDDVDDVVVESEVIVVVIVDVDVV